MNSTEIMENIPDLRLLSISLISDHHRNGNWEFSHIIDQKVLRRLRNGFSIQQKDNGNTDFEHTIKMDLFFCGLTIEKDYRYQETIMIMKDDIAESFDAENVSKNENKDYFIYNYIDDYLDLCLAKSNEDYFFNLNKKLRTILNPKEKANYLENEIYLISEVLERWERNGYFISDFECDVFHDNSNFLINEISKLKNDYKQRSEEKLNFGMDKMELLSMFGVFFELGMFRNIALVELMDFMEEHFAANGEEITRANKLLSNKVRYYKKSNRKYLDRQLLDNIIDKYASD